MNGRAATNEVYIRFSFESAFVWLQSFRAGVMLRALESFELRPLCSRVQRLDEGASLSLLNGLINPRLNGRGIVAADE